MPRIYPNLTERPATHGKRTRSGKASVVRFIFFNIHLNLTHLFPNFQRKADSLLISSVIEIMVFNYVCAFQGSAEWISFRKPGDIHCVSLRSQTPCEHRPCPPMTPAERYPHSLGPPARQSRSPLAALSAEPQLHAEGGLEQFFPCGLIRLALR